MPLFGNKQSGRRNYAAHGFSTSFIILGYAAYMFFQSPPPLDNLKITSGTFVRCDVEIHHSRHGHTSHVVLHVQPDGGGEQETLDVNPRPSQDCATLNPYVGRNVRIAHSRNPDPMGYLSDNFHDIVWQMQADSIVAVDYATQTARWQEQADWMTKFAGGLGLLFLVIALFEQRRGTN